MTATPAAMLGVQGVKGTLDAGADADLVVLSDLDFSSGSGSSPERLEGVVSAAGGGDGRRRELVVEEVWKFGMRIYTKGKEGRDGAA